MTFNFAISFSYFTQVEVEANVNKNLVESIRISQLDVSIEATVMDEAFLIATGARINNNEFEVDLELSVHFEGRHTGTEHTKVWQFKAISDGTLLDVGN